MTFEPVNLKWKDLLSLGNNYSGYRSRFHCNTPQKYQFNYVASLNADRLNEQELCDFKVIVQERTFHVHKCLISVASDFFKKVVSTNMREKYENSVSVLSVEPDIMEIILDFIYGKEVDFSVDNIDELLAASDFLQICELNKGCVEFISTTDVNEKNIIPVWRFAKSKVQLDLINKCTAYIQTHFIPLSNQKQFLMLSHDEIQEYLTLRDESTPEKCVYKTIMDWVEFDKPSRKQYFSKLFQVVDLEEMDASFVESEISNNELVKSNFESLQKLTASRSSITKKLMSKDIVVVACRSNQLDVIKLNVLTKKQSQVSTLEESLVDVAVACVKNELYVMGGCTSSSLNSCCTVRCLDLNKSPLCWTTMSSMKNKRHRFGCVAAENIVYVVGGRAHKMEYLSCAESYNIYQNSWTKVAAMQSKRAGCCLVEHSDNLYAIGGNSFETIHSSVEKFDGSQWSFVASMNVNRTDFSAVVLKGQLYVMGGETRLAHSCADVESYDFKNDFWCSVTSLHIPRAKHCACVLQETIFVIGGITGSKNGTISSEVYDPEAAEWITSEPNAKNSDSIALVPLR